MQSIKESYKKKFIKYVKEKCENNTLLCEDKEENKETWFGKFLSSKK